MCPEATNLHFYESFCTQDSRHLRGMDTCPCWLFSTLQELWTSLGNIIFQSKAPEISSVNWENISHGSICLPPYKNHAVSPRVGIKTKQNHEPCRMTGRPPQPLYPGRACSPWQPLTPSKSTYLRQVGFFFLAIEIYLKTD